MPSFDTEVTITGDCSIDFEVYCATCNCGLCNSTEVRRSRTRNDLQITVEACPDCMAKKDEEIKELKIMIEDLERLT